MSVSYTDKSYRHVKLASSLMGFVFVYSIIIKPLVENSFLSELNNLFVAVPFLATCIISSIGLFYALKGRKEKGHSNTKRFFSLFGNLFFVMIFTLLIFSTINDLLSFFQNN